MFNPVKSAQGAKLKYVNDRMPGIRRKRKGKGFVYQDERRNAFLSDQKTLARIRSLVIPPAWNDVWICKDADGHLQATGRDARSRKQYRYHERWTTQRNLTKFERLNILAEKVPFLRKKLEQDLKLQGLPRDKVLAAIVKIMLITRSRIGNSEYAEENETFGLTTILNRHARVQGSRIQLHFKGKSGIDHDISFKDQTLSKIVKRCQELPGQELFAYLDGERVIDVQSHHVNEYLRNVTGEDFTAKDLRTWSGTCTALRELLSQPPPESPSPTAFKKRHVSVIKITAASLRNTVAVCKKYYIHPVIFQADERNLLQRFSKESTRPTKYLAQEEKILARLLGMAIA